MNGTRFLIGALLKLRLHTPAALAALMMVDVALKLTGINALRRIVSDWPINGEAPDSGMVAHVCSTVIRACAWHPKKAHLSATFGDNDLSAAQRWRACGNGDRRSQDALLWPCLGRSSWRGG